VGVQVVGLRRGAKGEAAVLRAMRLIERGGAE